ncbi:MAG: class F sortase [Jatrophihabitantaceae bacterium]
MSEHARPRAKSGFAAWIPFLCFLSAILLVSGAAITWVTAPNWGKHNAIAAPRDVGAVPSLQGALAALISPYMIEIPRLKSKAPIVDVGTLASGALEIPANPRTVGWWSHGAKPGARKGTAILAGHINMSGVEGVLARIGTLNPGDLVLVDGLHGGKHTQVKFKITGVRTYAKKGLPYKEIFNQNSVGRLAIVTCGGPFDASTGNYLDNIVAYAVPV